MREDDNFLPTEASLYWDFFLAPSSFYSFEGSAATVVLLETHSKAEN